MMTINLQWVAYIAWLCAVWCQVRGIALFVYNFRGSDIRPMLATGLMLYYMVWSLGWAGLGWLIWRAFRKDQIR